MSCGENHEGLWLPAWILTSDGEVLTGWFRYPFNPQEPNVLIDEGQGVAKDEVVGFADILVEMQCTDWIILN